MKKNWILVTGGTGFIGFSLAKKLIKQNYNVKIITRQNVYSKPFQEFIDSYSEDRLIILSGDIKRKKQIEPFFCNIKYAYHIAALVNSILPFKEFHQANVIATQNICELCIKFKVKKLIYLSTSDVFGLPKNKDIFNEKSPYKYWGEDYPDTKIQATKCVKRFMEKGLCATIVYPGWVYGPGDMAFFPSILEQLKSGIMPIWDNNTFELSLVYIDDLIEALIIVLKDDKSHQEDFLILDENSKTTFLELSQKMATLFQIRFKAVHLPYSIVYLIAWFSQKLSQLKIIESPIMSTTDVKSFGYAFKFSTQKARKVLNWEVKTSLDDGLSLWKQWYIANQLSTTS